MSIHSPDYQFYKDYFEYFFQASTTTNREQGLLYFYLVSISIKFGPKTAEVFLLEQHISNSIQLTNLFLYLVGLSGLFKLLKLKGFKKSDILLSFSILNFFPQTLNLIVTMKPEILAFASITWLFYFIENFLAENNFKYLYFAIPSLILVVTSKATILGMAGLVFLYVLINYRKFFLQKEFLKILIIFFIILIPITIENFQANQLFISDHLVNNDNFKEVADLSILYNLNFEDLYVNPFRHYHANSLMGMVLLDTFGDYFRWYAYGDESAFSYIKSNFSSLWLITHWREFFSIMLTLIFYLSIFKFLLSDRRNKVYYSLPFFGLSILIAQAFGFPQKNFNRATAELFKTHYYSFLLVITLMFIVNSVIKKNRIYGYFVFLIFVFTTSFLYGFPSDSNKNYQEYLAFKNKQVILCEMNSYFIASADIEDCNKQQIPSCDVDVGLNILKQENIEEDNISPVFNLHNFESKEIVVSDLEECSILVNNGYRRNTIFDNHLLFPIFNSIYFLLFLFSIIFTSLFIKTGKNN